MRLQFWVPLSLLFAADFYWSCILILTPSTPQRQCNNILRSIKLNKLRMQTSNKTVAVLDLGPTRQSMDI